MTNKLLYFFFSKFKYDLNIIYIYIFIFIFMNRLIINCTYIIKKFYYIKLNILHTFALELFLFIYFLNIFFMNMILKFTLCLRLSSFIFCFLSLNFICLLIKQCLLLINFIREDCFYSISGPCQCFNGNLGRRPSSYFRFMIKLRLGSNVKIIINELTSRFFE